MGPSFTFGGEKTFYPVSAKDQSRGHQFGPKVLPGIFMGYALNAGESWNV